LRLVVLCMMTGPRAVPNTLVRGMDLSILKQKESNIKPPLGVLTTWTGGLPFAPQRCISLMSSLLDELYQRANGVQTWELVKIGGAYFVFGVVGVLLVTAQPFFGPAPLLRSHYVFPRQTLSARQWRPHLGIVGIALPTS
jgi:hypothetical protein